MRTFLLITLATSILGAQTAREKMQHGMTILQQSGKLAQEGKFQEAHKIMAEACAEIDAAVSSEPENLALRMQRGSVYARFPEFFNKAATARADLELAAKDPKYKEAAEKQLATLGGERKKERFAEVNPATTPLIAVASVTLPDAATIRSRGDLPPLLAKIMEQIRSYSGFLGSHVLLSADQPGMVLLFTWWKDKQSLAAWVDGDAHRAAIREVYSTPIPSHGKISSQVAMELLASLPGGMQFGGGLAPKGIVP